jgi:hypothetical protein
MIDERAATGQDESRPRSWSIARSSCSNGSGGPDDVQTGNLPGGVVISVELTNGFQVEPAILHVAPNDDSHAVSGALTRMDIWFASAR